MSLLMAFVLGFVQGVTEFLPISSTGHLILVSKVFAESNPEVNDLAFDAVLHLATLAAITLYFAKDLISLVHTVFRILGRLPVDDRDMVLIKALIVGTVPAVIAGVFLEDIMDTIRDPLVVAVTLLLGSVVFGYAEYVHARRERAPLGVTSGFKIGLFQALALIPGMSRSGLTISGGLILGLTRYEAARFAFLLAIPVTAGAGGKKMLELIGGDSGSVDWLPIGVGAVTAFLVGLASVHFMMKFVRQSSLWPFIWYRILLAIFVIALIVVE